MTSLTELFNPTFFMFLGITLLVAALLTAYFESKLREQNHKLTTMLSLVSSLAEELNGNKFAVNHLLNQVSGSSINVVPFQQNLEKTIVKKDMHELIEVSDDSDSDEEEEEDSLSEEESESDNDSDNDSTTKTVIGFVDNNDNIINFSALSDIKIFKINNQDLQEDLQEEENEFDDMPDLESVSSESSESSESLDLGLELGENINLDNVVEELSEVKEIEEQPLDLNEVKKINIMDLEEVKSIHAGEHNDYKKMSVQKLRTLVVERNLVADSSKMKKPELLKLLESEEKEEKEEKEDFEKVEEEI